MEKELLKVSGLNINIAGKAVVDNISFNINKGEVVCLVGESGSGKSLSALAIMGLLPEVARTSASEINFDGHNLLKVSEEEHRKLRGVKMSMIFQEPMTSLNPVMTVGAQVAEVFEIHSNLPKSEIQSKVIELFNKVQIKEPERRYYDYPFQLSGGQRQRVMIAMALAMKPQLLIADEPTTALDVTVQQEILTLINNLKDELDMAVLFITHDFGVVEEMANKVIVMQNGKVVEQGETKQLMQKPAEKYTKQLLEAMPKLKLDATEPKTKENSEIISTKGLSKTFMVKKKGFFSKAEKFEALKDINLTMTKGETIGIVGESGCGKSTLARCLVRLYNPDAGEIFFNGENITKIKGFKLKKARREMQMVFQDPFSSLNPRMKVGEIVGEGLRAHGTMSAKNRKEYVLELLQDCGLPTDSYSRYPHQFSGGQRQRIGIARALALKPALIIADEAVSALDVSVQKQILDLMANLKQKYELSYLFISHDLRVVSQVSDKVIVMHDGEIVERGSTSEVFTNPQHEYTKTLLAAIPHG